MTDTQRDVLDRLTQIGLGSRFLGLDDEDKIAVIVTCTRYGRDNNQAQVSAYARELLADVMEEHNPFVYAKFVADLSREYVSLAAVDRARRYTRYRYVRVGNEVTMSQIGGGSASYVFTMGGNAVRKASGDRETMETNVVQQTDRYIRGSNLTKYPYIAETNSGKYMSVTGEYVDGTDYACLVTARIEARVAILMEKIEDAFE